MAGDTAPGDELTATVYCHKCGGFYPLLDCVKRNAEHLVICCPNEDCGTRWLRYTARPPIAKSVTVNGVEMPPFVIRSTAMRGSSTAVDDDNTWPNS